MTTQATALLLDQATADYAANVGYDSPPVDLAKAHKFKEACRLLLDLKPAFIQNGEQQLRVDYRAVARELDRVNRFIDSKTASTSQVTLHDFRCFRE